VSGHRIHRLRLAAEPFGRAGVDQDVDPEHAVGLDDRHVLGVREREVARLDVRLPRLARVPVLQPGGPPAVEDAYVRVAVVAQQPPRPRRRSALPVVIDHDRAVGAHTGPAHGCLEPLLVGQRVPAALARRVSQVAVEVDVRRAGDVTRPVLLQAGRTTHDVTDVEHGDAIEVGGQLVRADERIGARAGKVLVHARHGSRRTGRAL
jgi:hypothetical protein